MPYHTCLKILMSILLLADGSHSGKQCCVDAMFALCVCVCVWGGGGGGGGV